MSNDVFVSYSSSDRTRALDVARALEALGWKVWIDSWRLLGGQAYRGVIEKELAGVGVVVVLWSGASRESDWVRAEASKGREREVLVPALIERVQPPMPFNELHTLDLADWDGRDARHPGLVALIDGVGAKLGREVPVGHRREPRSRSQRAAMALTPIAAAAALVALVLVWLVLRVGLSTPLVVGLPVFLAVFLFFVRATNTGAWAGRLVQALCGARGVAALLVLTLVLASFSSVSIEGPTGTYYPLAAELRSEEPEAPPVRADSLRIGGRQVRWLLPTPPWGRKLRVAVEGHAEVWVKLYPWRGATLELGDELAPRPVLCLRVNRKAFALVDEATLRIERDGSPAAEALMRAGQGSLLVGGAADLDRFAAQWSEELAVWPGPRERVVAAWCDPVRTEWRERAPALDDEVRVVFTTHGGQVWKSELFRLRGAFTDEECELELQSP